MSWRPETFCKKCDEPFEVYTAPEDRVCESCQELGPIEVSSRLSFYASHIRTVQQAQDARDDLAHYRRQDIARAFDRSSFEPRPLDDEPQENDPRGDAYDAARDNFEERN